MDPLTPDIRRVDPTDPSLEFLIDRHLTLMRASSPACSVHAMEADDLAEAGAVFLAAFEGATPVATGALKTLSGDLGELKSMHVIARCRGSGLADALLHRLLDEARRQGLTRVSLETGSQPPFAAARAFYARHGFTDCAPFQGYVEDENSVFMTREV